ncbi:hypothetical protein V8B97DRAFT_1971095 [Scleroderma yunnanense]
MPPRTRNTVKPSDEEDVEIVPDSEENIFDDGEDENDENAPINDENSAPLPAPSFVPRSSSLRTPMSHFSEDLVLRDITDQFFYPPSPSPIRISKNTLKRPAQSTLDPPRRPKKPKAQAYPADPPNWVHTTQPSSSLPPSSPLPTSATAYDNGCVADPAHAHISSARYEYELTSTPIMRAPDSDPFGFLAVERALKAKRAAAPPAPMRKPAPRVSTSTIKSPPRNTVVLSNIPTAPVRSSSVRREEPIPTNYENIDNLYLDEPVAGPSSRPLVPSAPLLAQQSAQKMIPEPHTSHSQSTFPDLLRTPRKRKRVNSPTPEDSAEDSLPSSPSPVKVSVGMTSGPRMSGRLHTRSRTQDRVPATPVQKHTRAQSAKVRGKQPVGKDASKAPPANKRLRAITRSHIPTPSSTPSVHRQNIVEVTSPSSAVPSPSPPKRRSARQAAAAKHPVQDLSSESEADGGTLGRIKTRLRSARSLVEPGSDPSPIRKPNTRSGSRGKATAASKSVKPPPRAAKSVVTRGRGRGKGKAVGATATRGSNSKGKRKARPLENVLGMSDDTRERYEKERRDRVKYFKRLEGYQIQKENVYVV